MRFPLSPQDHLLGILSVKVCSYWCNLHQVIPWHGFVDKKACRPRALKWCLPLRKARCWIFLKMPPNWAVFVPTDQRSYFSGSAWIRWQRPLPPTVLQGECTDSWKRRRGCGLSVMTRVGPPTRPTEVGVLQHIGRKGPPHCFCPSLISLAEKRKREEEVWRRK